MHLLTEVPFHSISQDKTWLYYFINQRASSRIISNLQNSSYVPFSRFGKRIKFPILIITGLLPPNSLREEWPEMVMSFYFCRDKDERATRQDRRTTR